MNRKRLEKIFCWKISGELKLFKFRILKMKKKDIFQAAYQIDTVICIYELLIETSTCMSKEALQAGISFPGILMFLYERWLSYEDVHMEDIMCCLNEELAKILKHYGEKKSKEKGNAA